MIAGRFAFTEGDIGDVVARARVAATWADRALDRDRVWEPRAASLSTRSSAWRR